MRSRVQATIGAVAMVAVFGAALWAIHRELAAHSWREISAAIAAIPRPRIVIALLCSAGSYLMLTANEALTMRIVRRAVPYRVVAATAFVANAFAHTIGLAGLSGASVRYRFYASRGIGALDVAKIAVVNALTIWVGFCALLAGVVFLYPATVLPAAGIWSRVGGAVALLAVAGYFCAAFAWRGRGVVTIRNQDIPVPGPRAVLLQIAIGAIDWSLAVAVLWALLPAESGHGFAEVAAAFLLAQVTGVASQVPGGLGVFESVVLVLLGDVDPAPAVLAALFVYRVFYYVFPLMLAAVFLAVREVRHGGSAAARVARVAGTQAMSVLPAIVAALTFAAGVVLLLSGATPPEGSRLAFLRDLVPLPFIETSHFMGSVTGMGLVLLARGLQRRLDAAWVLACGLLAAGAITSLVKGLDWEETTFLLATLAVLLPSHRYFHRKAALSSEPFTAAWIGALIAVIGGTTWMTLFAHRHIVYSGELWWRFAFSDDAPRSLRGLAGAAMVVAFAGLARLLQTAKPRPHPPGAAELDQAEAIVAASKETSAHLTLVGDKFLFFGKDGRGFIMYGIAGRSAVAMGDPVGPETSREDMAWNFRSFCDRYGLRTVFYEVAPASLPLYLELGLSLVKLGECARVPLERFSLQGNSAKSWRHAINMQEREGSTFEVVPKEKVPVLLPRLRAISDAWLRSKTTREKGFSLGFFDEAYISRGPVAVVRREGEILAFANLWIGAEQEELSIDLMRFDARVASGAMEYLILETMRWGKAQGFRSFDLGMAPLAGVGARPLGNWWSRVGAWLFRFGEHFYNFQGLRQFKEKFDPIWEPRYLAYPGGLSLPRVLIDVTVLTSGGLEGVVTR